jgi:hypothetical protein
MAARGHGAAGRHARTGVTKLSHPAWQQGETGASSTRMESLENIVELRGTARPVSRTDEGGATGARAETVAFNARELQQILNVYGRMVAAGEWRDYAVDWLREAAVFSIFRRTAEVPLYRIEKRPKLRTKQGAYAVISATGFVLKRGHELPAVLRVFDRMLVKAVEG